MADDPNAKLEAMLKDSMPVLEELADTCETISRSVRALNLLMNCRVDPDVLLPHFETATRAFAALVELGPRLGNVARKHRPV